MGKNSKNSASIGEKLDTIIELLEKMLDVVDYDKYAKYEEEGPDIVGPIFYEVEDLERILKLTKHTIRGFIHEGKLRAHRIGKNFRIFEEDLNEFLRKSMYEADGSDSIEDIEDNEDNDKDT